MMMNSRRSLSGTGRRARLEAQKEEVRVRPDLLVDIVDGRLQDMGRDAVPGHQKVGSDEDAASVLSRGTRPTSAPEWDMLDTPKVGTGGGKVDVAPAAQVLGLAVGLLGLEVHDAPNPWSEAWLSFEDNTRRSLGLGGPRSEKQAVRLPDGGRVVKRKYNQEQAEWQITVLERLRNLISYGKVHLSDEDLANGPQVEAHSGYLGPEFQEHLELSEFCIRRITHAVGALQDPSQQERPMLLRDYTDKQVLAVCKDLRQWLKQLADLFALYHVKILDLEKDRRRLLSELGVLTPLVKEHEERRREAEHRFARLEEIRKEEQMKQRADSLLGLSLTSGDPKIYTQRDVEDMKLQWKREMVDPLLAELAELRRENEAGNKLKRGSTRVLEDEVSKESLKAVQSAVYALAERTAHEEAAGLLERLGVAMGGSGPETVNDVLKAIFQLQTLTELGETPRSKAKAEEQFSACVDAIANEMKQLQAGLEDFPELKDIGGLADWTKSTVEALKTRNKGLKWKPAPKWQISSELKSTFASSRKSSVKPESAHSDRGSLSLSDDAPIGKALAAVTSELSRVAKALEGHPGGDSLAGVISWGRKTIALVKANPENVSWQPPPRWSLEGLGSSEPPKANTANIEALWKARMDAQRAEYEEKLRALMEQLEAEKEKTAEALRRLAEETKRADDLINQLRKKLVQMQDILKKNGLGQQAESALWESGLAEFLNGRDVFERLYRDAVMRMRRLAEAQVKVLQESSEEYARSVRSAHSVATQEGESATSFFRAPYRSATSRSEARSSVVSESSPRNGKSRGASRASSSDRSAERSGTPGLRVTRLGAAAAAAAASGVSTPARPSRRVSLGEVEYEGEGRQTAQGGSRTGRSGSRASQAALPPLDCRGSITGIEGRGLSGPSRSRSPPMFSSPEHLPARSQSQGAMGAEAPGLIISGSWRPSNAFDGGIGGLRGTASSLPGAMGKAAGAMGIGGAASSDGGGGGPSKVAGLIAASQGRGGGGSRLLPQSKWQGQPVSSAAMTVGEVGPLAIGARGLGPRHNQPKAPKESPGPMPMVPHRLPKRESLQTGSMPDLKGRGRMLVQGHH